MKKETCEIGAQYRERSLNRDQDYTSIKGAKGTS